MDEQSSGISRRRFLAVVSTGVAAGGLAYLTGCGQTQTPSPPTGEVSGPTTAPVANPTATPSAPVPTATRGLQTLRFATSAAPFPTETLDPAVGLQSMTRICAIYDQLTELDDAFKPQPMLAESWEPNDKADAWTFKLRRDVTFHDGSKLTAKDVVYSYRRVLDPATASPAAAALAGLDPEGIEAVDDYTVRFKLPSPLVHLPVMINTKFTYIIKDGYTAGDIKANPLGTGPFKVQHFVAGEDPTILVRNPNYFRPGRPQVDVLELRGIPEPAARTPALTRGQVDIIDTVSLTDLEQLKQNADLAVISQPTGNWDGFIMQIDQPPFDDNRVRQALKYCVDRQQMIDLVLLGEGRPANDVPVPSWFDYGLDEPPRARDIAQAKALLADAGYANGLEVELWTSTTNANWVSMATVFKEMAAEAGVTVTVQMGAADTYWTEVWLKKPFCMTDWSARPADGILAEAFLSTSDWNETHWKRQDWDEMLLKARGTTNYDERKALYQQAQRLLIDEGGVIVPFFWNSLAATRANIAGYKPQPRYIFYDFSTVGFSG